MTCGKGLSFVVYGKELSWVILVLYGKVIVPSKLYPQIFVVFGEPTTAL